MTIVFKTATHTVGDHLTDFMDELGIKAPTLSKHLAVPRSRIVRLIDGARRDGDMPCAWRAISAPRRNTGSICRRYGICPRRR